MNRQEVKLWLRSYKHIKKERDGILELIGELEEDRAASQLNGMRLTGMPGSGRISDPTAESAAKFAALLESYEAHAASLYDRMREIEDAIEYLPEQQRDILRSYYIRGMSWAKVAKKQGYSESHCWKIAGDGITALAQRR